MNTIEDLLRDVVAPKGLDPCQPAWARVEQEGRSLQRRRAIARPTLGVAGLLLLVVLRTLLQRNGADIDLITAPPAAEPITPAPAVGTLWPTSADIFAAAGPRAAGQFAIGWLIVLGAPLLAAAIAWDRSWPIAANVGARIDLSLGIAIEAMLTVGVALGLTLFLSYDALGAQTGTSWAVSTAQIFVVVAPWLVAIGAAIALRELRHGRLGWLQIVVAALFGGWGSSTLLGLLASSFGWTQRVGGEGPSRGVWQLLIPGEFDYLRLGEPVAVLRAWFMLLVAVIGIWTARWIARKLWKPNQIPPVRSEQERQRATPASFAAGSLVFLVFLLASWTLASQDVRARESLHVVSLPSALVDDAEVVVTRQVDRNIFDENTLFEIVIHGRESSITSVPNAVLLNATQFGRIDIQPGGAELVRFGVGRVEIWEIDRDVERNTITMTAARRFVLPGLNTVIYLSIVALFAATSRRILGRPEEAVVGRDFVSWYSIIGSSVIGFRMVSGLFRLEADVGTLADRGGQSIFDVYTADREMIPLGLSQMSGWFFFPFHAGALIPVFGLALIGVRRLGAGRLTQIVLCVAAVVVTAAIGLRFGSLISDWIDFILD